MKNKAFLSWTRELADKDGKYGGGSAVSVVGALTASLAQFVFELQSGKEKYKDREDEIQEAIKKAAALNEDFLDLAELDADAFEPVIPLFKLPQNTEEEKAYRRRQLDAALEKASEPPFEMMRKMYSVLELFDKLLELEVRGTIADDILIGLHFIEVVAETGKISCMVNINLIKDEAQKARLTEEVEGLYNELIERAKFLLEEAERIFK